MICNILLHPTTVHKHKLQHTILQASISILMGLAYFPVYILIPVLDLALYRVLVVNLDMRLFVIDRPA